jgi:hypothetical protein
MRNRPSRLAGPRASRERSEPPDASRRVLPAVMAEEYGAIDMAGYHAANVSVIGSHHGGMPPTRCRHVTRIIDAVAIG